MARKVLVEVSVRHLHISRKDLEVLFGESYKLKVLKKLSQPREFASSDTVTLINSDRKIENVRILGPERNNTQVELAKTDAVHLRLDAPVKESGDVKGSPGITIEGPKGKIKLKEGVIIAKRHLHASDKDAKALRIKNKQHIKIRIPGDRETIFGKVLVRVSPKYKLAVHLDTDEGNAAGVNGKTFGELIK